MFLEDYNTFECSHSVFVHNLNYGIDVFGCEGKVFLSENKVLFNEPVGIRVGISMQAFLLRNQISHNLKGVLLISCRAKLVNNLIKINKKAGVETIAVNGLLNDSELKMNKLVENEGPGLIISGENNHTLVQSNIKISEN